MSLTPFGFFYLTPQVMKICEKCLPLQKKLSSVAVPRVGFKLIASLLYLQFVFEIGTKIAFLLLYLNSFPNCIIPFPKKCTSQEILFIRLLVCPVSNTLIRAGVAVSRGASCCFYIIVVPG